ncbi:2-isopropylmalate synthase [Methanogenium marinum]|uniref:Probable 2-isopropylmalate synthase n=1 Tax=Methanogenium marinum TaxID=348610 RepID=A0A9Q4PV41_9EURY|nr:2-isopropylmalate synthase [Methanogenium marinum]MDE4907585.1 2-isopropylmalate synthase [Methanogenium marinum]
MKKACLKKNTKPGQSQELRQVAFFGDSKRIQSRVTIFDTTLRDGEQTPGVSFTRDEKVTIAHQLSDIGVHAIEAGFPASSDDEKTFVREIASEGLESSICGLARATQRDVEACADCGVDIIHVFIPTSEVQRVHTIKKTHEEVVEITRSIVRFARDHADQVMFSAMDATRTGIDELTEVYQTAVDAGATILNVPDTVGVASPTSMKALLSTLSDTIACPLDVHCHNDFGMAVANTISAVEGGASQVQVTVNGIGERAGNADIAQTVMALESIYGIRTGISTERLVETSRMVSRFSGISVGPTHPVVGENAFAHESGIHSQGVLAEASTFEPGIMTPEMVGHRRRLKLGKHVGRHAVSQMLSDAHITTKENELDEIVAQVKEISNRGRKVTENDLFEIAETIIGKTGIEKTVVLNDITVINGNHVMATATVRANVEGKETICCRIGNGPVDAAMKAVVGIVPEELTLKEFSVSAISGGSDAIGHVSIAVEDAKGRLYDASASSDDIVLASAEAMVNALNLVYRLKK